MMGVVGVADVALVGMELWLLVRFVFGKKKEKKTSEFTPTVTL